MVCYSTDRTEMALKIAILPVSLMILNGSFCLASFMLYKIVREGYTPLCGITSLGIFTFSSISQCAARCSNLNGLCRGFIYQLIECVNISTSNNNCQLLSFTDPSFVTLSPVKNVCRRFYVADPWNNKITRPDAGKLINICMADKSECLLLIKVSKGCS
jgi:hypothetical protein